MLKTELINRVSELETRLSNEKGKEEYLLHIMTGIFYGKDNQMGYTTRSGYNTGTRIENREELFYEVGKLIEFRNNTLQERGYIRDKEDKGQELEYLRHKLEEINPTLS